MKEKQILTEVVICDSVTRKPLISTTVHESLSRTFAACDKNYRVGDTLKTQYEDDYKIEEMEFLILGKTNPNNVWLKSSNQADEQEKEANPFNLSLFLFVKKISKG